MGDSGGSVVGAVAGVMEELETDFGVGGAGAVICGGAKDGLHLLKVFLKRERGEEGGWWCSDGEKRKLNLTHLFDLFETCAREREEEG